MERVRHRWPSLLALVTAWGCAATTAPTPPPEETLLVVNGGENSLTLVPVDRTKPTKRILLGTWPGIAQRVDARGGIALVTGGESDVLFVVDLVTERLERVIPLEPGSHPTGVVIADQTVAYVTNAGRNTVTRVDFQSGDTASIAVGVVPVAGVLTRGFVFVVNANVGPCDAGPSCPLGPSWLTVVDPRRNALATGRDSIPLPGDGALWADVGGDGLIYVISTGDEAAERPGRLMIVDPVRREEVGSFAGFGFVPSSLASDGGERLFVTSTVDGLMEFNTRTRRVVRGAGGGVLAVDAVAVAVDSHGSVYALESGGCTPGSKGRLRVFRPDLTEARNIVMGECPTAAAMVQIPVPPEPPEPQVSR